MTEINRMPIRDRKAFIKKHNGEELKKIKKNKKYSDSPILLNQVARMKQEELKNMDK